MKRLLTALFLTMTLLTMSSPLSFAEEIREKSSESFNVFEIFSVDSTPDNPNEFKLLDDLVDEAGDETSPVGALILRVINMLSLLIGTFGMVMIIIAGFMLASSSGDESRIDRGKAMLTQTIVGMVIAFLAYFIVRAIISFFY